MPVKKKNQAMRSFGHFNRDDNKSSMDSLMGKPTGPLLDVEEEEQMDLFIDGN